MQLNKLQCINNSDIGGNVLYIWFFIVAIIIISIIIVIIVIAAYLFQ